jgi:hypothetical protein
MLNVHEDRGGVGFVIGGNGLLVLLGATGWMIAVTLVSVATSTPSSIGKKGEVITVPLVGTPSRLTAMMPESTREVYPIPLPTVASFRQEDSRFRMKTKRGTRLTGSSFHYVIF